jgi:hypothetical protein
VDQEYNPFPEVVSKNWRTYRKPFVPDGALRDIYVFNTDLDDWNRVAEFISRSGLEYQFSGAWAGLAFPSEISRLFQCGPDSDRTCLGIQICGVLVNCHFFMIDEIDFDLVPNEIDGPEKLQGILHFMLGMAKATGKPVLLTMENRREDVFFRCGPSDVKIEHVHRPNFEFE